MHLLLQDVYTEMKIINKERMKLGVAGKRVAHFFYLLVKKETNVSVKLQVKKTERGTDSALSHLK